MASRAETWHLGEYPIDIRDLQTRADQGACIHLDGNGPILVIREFVPDKEAFSPSRK